MLLQFFKYNKKPPIIFQYFSIMKSKEKQMWVYKIKDRLNVFTINGDEQVESKEPEECGIAD